MKKKALPIPVSAIFAALALLAGCALNTGPAQPASTAATSGDHAVQQADETSEDRTDASAHSQTAMGFEVKKEFSVGTAFDPLSEAAQDAVPAEFLLCEGGFIYEDENGLYGIISPDFRHDTGAVYAQAQPRGELFMVTADGSVYAETPESLNRFSLVTAQGEELLSAQYADFYVTGNFVAAMKAAERASRSGGALLTYTNLQFLAPEAREDTKESAVYFQGEWQVYDLLTMMPVAQASGAAPGKWAACGKFIGWTDARGRSHAATALGGTLPEGAQLLDSGDYSLTENTIATVYNADGEKLFSYDPQDYMLKYASAYGVYCCVSNTQNDNRAYSFFLLDENGVRGHVMLPSGFLLQEGITIRIGTASLQFPLMSCIPEGCVADIRFNQQQLALLQTSTQVDIAIILRSGEAMHFPFALQGFQSAFQKMSAAIRP